MARDKGPLINGKMSTRQIVDYYRKAEKKKGVIDYLAKENATTTKYIKELLLKNGIKLPGFNKRDMKELQEVIKSMDDEDSPRREEVEENKEIEKDIPEIVRIAINEKIATINSLISFNEKIIADSRKTVYELRVQKQELDNYLSGGNSNGNCCKTD